MAKKLKDIVRVNAEPARGKVGLDPMDPWSAKANLGEASLEQYLMSKGINPKFVSKDTKISHAKSSSFIKWKQDHQFESVESLDEDALLDKFLMSRGINPRYATKDMKISHAKSGQFLKWKRDHIVEELTEAGTVKTSKMTTLQKFRADAAAREKKHDDIEKEMKARHAAGKEDMKGSIDRLEKHLNKEETLSELNYDTVKSLYKKRRDDFHGAEVGKKKKGKEVSAKNVSRSISRLTGFKPTQNQPQKEEFNESGIDEATGISKEKETKFHKKLDKLVHNTFGKRKDEMKMKEEVVTEAKGIPVAHGYMMHQKHAGKYRIHSPSGEHVGDVEKEGNMWRYHGSSNPNWPGTESHKDYQTDKVENKHEAGDIVAHLHHSGMKNEEVEQIDEISKSTLSSYKDKSSASLKNAQANRDAAEPGKNMSKGFADLHAKSDAIAKKRVKGLMGYMQRKQGLKPMGEDVYQDSQAATQTAFDMGTTPNQTEPTCSRKKEMSKSARIIKDIYKKKRMVKEDMYDHEKEDKSIQTYGKKPKVMEPDEKKNLGEKKPEARIVMSGGTTLTGEKRDTVEIDPAMKVRPGPDTFGATGKKASQQ